MPCLQDHLPPSCCPLMRTLYCHVHLYLLVMPMCPLYHRFHPPSLPPWALPPSTQGKWQLPGSWDLAGQYHGPSTMVPWGGATWWHPLGGPTLVHAKWQARGLKALAPAPPPLIPTFLPTLPDRPGAQPAPQPGPCLQSSDCPQILHTLVGQQEGQACLGGACLGSEPAWPLHPKCWAWQAHAMHAVLAWGGALLTAPFSHAMQVAHCLLSISSANSQPAPTWLVGGMLLSVVACFWCVVARAGTRQSWGPCASRGWRGRQGEVTWGMGLHGQARPSPTLCLLSDSLLGAPEQPG
jgi:hypothetical protein